VAGRSLGQIAMGEAFATVDNLNAAGGALSVPAGGMFTSSAPLGGWLRNPVSGGPATVATLMLQVAGVPGTYTLGVVDGMCYIDTGETPMETGVPFLITVQGQ